MQAEHAGQMALLRIEIKELSEAAKKGGRGVEGIDEKLLQKIAVSDNRYMHIIYIVIIV